MPSTVVSLRYYPCNIMFVKRLFQTKHFQKIFENFLKFFWNFFGNFFVNLKFYIIPWEDSNAWIANIFWTGPSHIRPETYIVSSAFCLWNNEKLSKNNQNLDSKMTNPPLKMIWCYLEIWILFRRLFVIFIFDIWHFIFFTKLNDAVLVKTLKCKQT